MPSRWGRRLAAAALMAAASAGCGTLESTARNVGSSRADLRTAERQASTVTLPVSQAGITDARQAFAELFLKKLSAVQGDHPEGRSSVQAWLHGIDTPRQQDSPSLLRIKRAFPERAGSTSVLVAPGMFGDCVDTQAVPFGDGVVRSRERNAVQAYQQYASLNLHGIRLLALPGRASSANNGGLIAQAIREESSRVGVESIVLVGYSKGTPDLLHALVQLEQEGGVPKAVKAMISVAGAVMGTPIADHYERLYQSISPLLQPFDCSASDGTDLSSLTQRERTQWLAMHRLPASVRYYSVTAYAPRGFISLALRPTFDQLSAHSARNDGQLLTSDAILPNSMLLAEAMSDHWNIALPLDRHPNRLVRALSSRQAFPREALFRALLQWVVAQD